MNIKTALYFYYQVQEGPASQSYGLQVAALAGVPQTVIQKAKEILYTLENQSVQNPNLSTNTSTDVTRMAEPIQQFDMFASAVDPKVEKIQSLLNEIDPNELTPRMALDAIYQLKALQK